MEDPTGIRIGEYRLVDRLGAGGMGEVWRAEHVRLGRTVAVKLLSGDAVDPSFADRFLNEARIQASLQHPNIATLFELVQHGDRPCIVMEYVDGETVAELLRREGPMRTDRALAVLRQVVDAVAYVHERGIVHRDIKANNVKLTADGTAKLLDFGIARGTTSPRLTLRGQFIGTLHACAPEQLRGGAADQRSDVWSLGVLLYELVTGRVPFDADSVGEFVREVERGSYPPAADLVADVPPAVDRLIARCLEPDPERRFQSAGELAAALLHGGGDAPAHDPPGREHPPVAAPFVPVRGRRERWPLVAAAALLAVVAVVALAVRSCPSGGPGAATATPLPTARARSGGPVEATVSIGLVGATAKVTANGRSVGTTPCRFSAPVGSQVEVVLEVDGYRPLVKRLEVLPHSNDYVWSVREFASERGSSG